jgi:MFS family permease
VYASVSALAVAVAPLLGGAIAQGFGWRWIFGINVPVGAVVIALNRKLPHVERGSGARPDVAGAALATAALFAMNIVLLRGPEVGWGSPFTLSVAVICAAAVTALVAYLYGEPERLLDLRMLRSRGFSGAALIGILARFFGLGPIVFISLDLEGVMGYTPLQAGLRLLAMPVPLLIFSPVGGWLKERWGAGQTMALGLAVSAIGLAWSSAAAATADWTALLPALVLCGAGGGLYTPVLIGVALTAVPPSRAGQASGMLNACFPLGTALGVAVLGLVLRVTVNERLPRAPALLRGAAQSGDVSRVAADGASVARAARSAFTSGLSAVLLSAACVAALATVIAVVAIRRPGGHGVPSP